MNFEIPVTITEEGVWMDFDFQEFCRKRIIICLLYLSQQTKKYLFDYKLFGK